MVVGSGVSPHLAKGGGARHDCLQIWTHPHCVVLVEAVPTPANNLGLAHKDVNI